MKILIGYDGSACSDAAINDLQRAGLGDDVEAIVLTAVDAWPAAGAAMLPGTAIDPTIGGVGALTVSTIDELAKRAMEEATAAALGGVKKLSVLFPSWTISHATSADSPASAILARADAWRPDLIVVGSHGHSAAGRFFLGSTSQSVLHHAACSVRIGRAPDSSEATTGVSGARSTRLVIGIDGSSDSLAASFALGKRVWPSGTEVRVVGATDLAAVALAVRGDSSVSTVAAAVASLQAARLQLQRDVGREADHLHEHGLLATPVLRDGSARRVLLEEADRWHADCIFVGARGMGRLVRLLLGSVSSGVAAGARCSVEVVRT
jgi:nucleotide-binding universal stress UspA family protein